MAESRYVLALVYQAGRDEAIVKGLDDTRDFFTTDELEKAAWSFLPGGGEVGLFHSGWKSGVPDQTLMGHARVVENYIYRGPDWQMGETLIKAGDWLAGLICDDLAWELVKSGKITGLSMQGSAKRRKPQ
jgi:hypothetical protein